MSLGVAFGAGQASCSQSSLCGRARSYAVFVYGHPVVFTVARSWLGSRGLVGRDLWVGLVAAPVREYVGVGCGER